MAAGNGSSALEALIFDVDGTLADTERHGHRVAFNLAFEELGLDWHWDEPLYGELLAVTGGKERIAFFVENYLPAGRRPEDVAALARELHACKTRHFTRLLDEGRIALRAGVARLLDEASGEGLRLAIATTTTPANVEALISNTLGADAAGRFEVIGAGDVVPAKKPAPDIYHYVLERMSLKAGACLAFEDSANGLRAARGAGIGTVVTVNGYTRDEDFNGALLVVDQLGEPGEPPVVLAGDLAGARFVDVSCLRALHAGARRGAA